jgi:tRNA A37 N6-isopentenylltransferase MiaA
MRKAALCDKPSSLLFIGLALAFPLHFDTEANELGAYSMSSTLFDLSGRTALVTGGSMGLGKAMARALAKAGASVAISSNDDELRSTATEIAQESHAKVVPLAAEMTHRREVQRLAERAIAALGRSISSSITREGTRRSRSIRSPARFGITSSS